MEEVGGGGSAPAPRLNGFDFALELLALAKFPNPEHRAQRELGIIQSWLTAGFEPDLDIRATIRDIASRPNFHCDGLTYFTKMIRERHDSRMLEIPAGLKRTSPPPAEFDEQRWRALLAAFDRFKRWHKDAGPEPGKPGCLVPPHLLAEFGLAKGEAA